MKNIKKIDSHKIIAKRNLDLVKSFGTGVFMHKFVFSFLSLCFITTCSGLDLFVVHSIPKCGTHFIETTIHFLTEKKMAVAKITESNLQNSIKLDFIIRSISAFNQEVAQLLSDHHYKMVCIYRDPRDAIVSLVVYLRSFNGQGVYRDFFQVDPDFDQLSFDDQMLSVMTSEGSNKNYFDYYRNRIEWHKLPLSYGVKYENLVGSNGGGDDATQLNEILQIASHINQPITPKKAKKLASSVYRSRGIEYIEGKEFHHAQIGSWKQFLNPQHIQIVKEKFNDVLISLGYEENGDW